MQKLSATLALLVFLLLFVPSVLAQDDERPEFKMPCQDVLKLTLYKFTDIYGEKTQDYSTYGMKQAYGYYVDCKRPQNDAQSQRLGEAKNKQVEAIRTELTNIGNSAWDMTYVSAGGGTMYGLMAVAAYGAREEFMASIIAGFSNDRPKPAARRRANINVAKARRLLKQWSRMPKLEVYGDQTLAETQKIYRDAMKELQDAAARLLAMIPNLPDTAAERVTARLVRELDI